MKEDFSNWTLGETIDHMIRIRTSKKLTEESRKEYIELVNKLDKTEELIKKFLNSKLN